MKVLPSKDMILPTAIVALAVIIGYQMYSARRAKSA